MESPKNGIAKKNVPVRETGDSLLDVEAVEEALPEVLLLACRSCIAARARMVAMFWGSVSYKKGEIV